VKIGIHLAVGLQTNQGLRLTGAIQLKIADEQDATVWWHYNSLRDRAQVGGNECRVECAVRIHPGQIGARHAQDLGKLTANEYLAIRLNRHRRQHGIRPGYPGVGYAGIHTAIRIEPHQLRARSRAELRDPFANPYFAIVLAGQRQDPPPHLQSRKAGIFGSRLSLQERPRDPGKGQANYKVRFNRSGLDDPG
jgi:hypothetical protein